MIQVAVGVEGACEIRLHMGEKYKILKRAYYVRLATGDYQVPGKRNDVSVAGGCSRRVVVLSFFGSI